MYGTDSHPRKSPTSVRSPKDHWGDFYNRDRMKQRNPPQPNPHHNPFFRYFRTTLYPPTTTTTTTTRDYNKADSGNMESRRNGQQNGLYQRKNDWSPDSFPYWESKAFASKSSTYARLKHQHSNPAAHTCVYETLPKKSNLSSSSSSSYSSGAQFPRNARPKLTAGKLP